MSRLDTSTKLSVIRMISSIPSTPRSAMLRRCLTAPRSSSLVKQPPRGWFARKRRPLGDHHVAEDDAFVADVDHLVAAGRQVLADVVRSDGELAMPPVDHDGELDLPGPPVV